MAPQSKDYTLQSSLQLGAAIWPSSGQWDVSRSVLPPLPPASWMECGCVDLGWSAIMDNKAEKQNPRNKGLWQCGSATTDQSLCKRRINSYLVSAEMNPTNTLIQQSFLPFYQSYPSCLILSYALHLICFKCSFLRIAFCVTFICPPSCSIINRLLI